MSNRWQHEAQQQFTDAGREPGRIFPMGTKDSMERMRAQREAQQRSWMEQRQRAQERSSVEGFDEQGHVATAAPTAAVPTAAGGAAGGGGGAGGVAVIDQLAEKIEHRLRNELSVTMRQDAQRQEAQQRVSNAASDQRTEHDLTEKVGGQTCPVCLELMMPPERSPMLLFPCGHTFCVLCLRPTIPSRQLKICPLCRAQISSHAPNVALAQLVESYADGQLRKSRDADTAIHAVAGSYTPGQDGAIAAVSADYGAASELHLAGGAAGQQYLRQFSMASTRLRVLSHERADALEEAASAERKEDGARLVLQRLEAERERTQAQLEALGAQLELITEHAAEQAENLGEMGRRKENGAARLRLLDDALSPLRSECDKLRLLLEGLGVDVPDE